MLQKGDRDRAYRHERFMLMQLPLDVSPLCDGLIRRNSKHANSDESHDDDLK